MSDTHTHTSHGGFHKWGYPHDGWFMENGSWKILFESGWWLYTHPVLKNMSVSWDDDSHPIFMGK